MPIARNVTYKCKKCGYIFSKMEGDVITEFPKCPKCGSFELKILSSKFPFENDNIFVKIFKKIKGS